MNRLGGGGVVDELIPDEVRSVYTELVTNGSKILPVDELSRRDSTLHLLLERGFAVATPRTPPDLAAVSPAAVAQRLLIRWRQSVQSLRQAMFDVAGAMIAMQERAAGAEARSGRQPACQLLVDPTQVDALRGALHHSPMRSLDSWSTGPFGEPRTLPDGTDQRVDGTRLFLSPARDFLATGGRARCIYDREVLTRYPATAELATAAGEEARVVERTLPMKLLLIDDHTALVPLRPYGHPALYIRDRRLVAFLRVFYELVWAQAQPLAPGRQATTSVRSLRRQITELMAAGLKDDAIARQCGVSTRTVRRHIAALMSELGAATRFAAGVAAVRRGLIPARST